ncbi:MAG: hypothetical protein CMF74_06885 [Maricaulis sp.]|jgi:AcrR family transcriptional regulator|nr:hypothetical protein [Maricaulis sp.]HAQ36073.1 hypothetical protein [Alphaproteobacteria bacterium]
MASQGVKPAEQLRARETRDKLVAALERLLKEKAFTEISVAEIASEAGVAVGTVYRRFENKDALIPVVFDLYRARVEAQAASPEGRFEPDLEAGLRPALRELTRRAWRFLGQDGHLVRAAHLHARLRPDLVGDEWEAMIEASVTSYGLLVDAFDSEVKRGDRDAAARFVFYMLNTLLVEYGLYPQDGPGVGLGQMSGPDFTDSVADAIYGYLATPDS